MHITKGVKFLLVILPVLILSCRSEENEPAKPFYEIQPRENIPAFNPGNAYTQILKQLTFGPRNPNSNGHQAVLQFLILELSKYAEDVIIQNFNYSGYDGEVLLLTNIVAKFNIKAKNGILLCAHWDTRPRAEEDQNPDNRDNPIPGANDGGSGVAILLETARILKSYPVDYGVDIVLFDGEDYGRPQDLENFCLGSKYFAGKKSPDYNPAFGILLDLVGDKEAKIFKDPFSMQYASDITDLIWNIAEMTRADKFVNVQGSRAYDDHIPLNQAGIKTINIINADLIA